VNGNIFPQVLAPSIEVSNETTAALQKQTHQTFGSIDTAYTTQLRTQIKQQQMLIKSMMQQIQDLQHQQESTVH
jgi:superoxide dismutase